MLVDGRGYDPEPRPRPRPSALAPTPANACLTSQETAANASWTGPLDSVPPPPITYSNAGERDLELGVVDRL